MNATATAVTLIIFAALILACMAGIGDYVIGRVRATDDAKMAKKQEEESLHEALLGLKADTILVSDVLLFTQSRSFDYRAVAIKAVEALSDDALKETLEREFQNIDKKIQDKVAKVEEDRCSKKG